MKNKLKISNTRIKNIFKNNIKIVIGFTIGLLIAGASVYAATIYFASSEVSYDDTKVSGTLGASTVQDALDELYDKAKNCGKYAKINITNGTVSPSSKNVIGDSTTFDVTPNVDYGCDSSINSCFYQCSNGATVNIPDNSTTLTVSNIVQNTECNIRLVRIKNFSYTSSNTTDSDKRCCGSSFNFSTAYGTFKITGTVYDTGKKPLNYYCAYDSASSGSSCTVYTTTIYKTNSCVTATTDSSYVCGNANATTGSGLSSYTYNVTEYTSNRTESCGSSMYEGLCPTSW